MNIPINKNGRFLLLMVRVLLVLLVTQTALASKDESDWHRIKKQYYGEKTIQENNNIIEIKAPYRAEDPALVPIKIISKLTQTKHRYIKKIMVFVDKNPYPFVGEFTLTPLSGKPDLAMRIRVNSYSYVRTIAQMNDDTLYMSKKFVKASGGCSAPLGKDLDAAMKRLGKVKFKLSNPLQKDQPTLVQLLISHPNITGMQMDQVTRFTSKPYFVDQLQVTFDGQPILTAKTDIAISADPNFRFYFIPKKSAILKATFSDISCETPTNRDVCSKKESYSLSYKVDL